MFSVICVLSMLLPCICHGLTVWFICLCGLSVLLVGAGVLVWFWGVHGRGMVGAVLGWPQCVPSVSPCNLLTYPSCVSVSLTRPSRVSVSVSLVSLFHAVSCL